MSKTDNRTNRPGGAGTESNPLISRVHGVADAKKASAAVFLYAKRSLLKQMRRQGRARQGKPPLPFSLNTL